MHGWQHYVASPVLGTRRKFAGNACGFALGRDTLDTRSGSDLDPDADAGRWFGMRIRCVMW